MGCLDGFLNQTIGLEGLHSIDQYGDPSYNANVSYPCRIERRIRRVRNQQGEEVVSTVQVYLDGAVAVDYHDRITLPASMDSSTPVILAIEEGIDEDGSVQYVEVDT